MANTKSNASVMEIDSEGGLSRQVTFFCGLQPREFTVDALRADFSFRFELEPSFGTPGTLDARIRVLVRRDGMYSGSFHARAGDLVVVETSATQGEAARPGFYRITADATFEPAPPEDLEVARQKAAKALKTADAPGLLRAAHALHGSLESVTDAMSYRQSLHPESGSEGQNSTG
ncbi:hypothetical protein [Thioalkalivibrio sp. ALE19]|uniref:hypothetical protein n=1 Tax=Thioalkalivibrio sp. ALE19 TaxID=1266909 RepID=UPI00048B124F|nr:hypothetical protein [Thioalkalivibrio sp. ALE19]